MRKYILTFLLASIFSIALSAQEIKRGYRGFLDWQTDFFYEHYHTYVGGDGISQFEYHKEVECLLGVSTSHGYQFSNHFFLGAGLTFQVATHEDRLRYPFFIQARTDWTIKGIPVYGDLKIGSALFPNKIYGSDDKFFITPTIGYRWDWGRRVKANFGAGVSLHGVDDHPGHYTFHPMPAIRVGIEF